jgi:hypothetical protein
LLPIELLEEGVVAEFETEVEADDARDLRFITLATRRFLLFGRLGVLPPLPLFSSESVLGVRVMK